MDKFAFGIGDGAFHRMELLGQVHAGLPFLNHGNDLRQVPVGTFEPLRDIGVGGVAMLAFHVNT